MSSKAYLHIALSAFLVGCGGSASTAGFGSSPNGSSPGQPSLSGRVLNESGLPLAQVRLVAHERTSNAKFQGVSGADGTFNLPVDAGVYDLGLDLAADPGKATCFYGPYDTNEGARDFILHEAGARAKGAVFGKIWLTPGVPANQRRLNLRHGFLHKQKDLPVPVPGRTLADGSFELLASSENELGLDLEVYDAQDQMDEFVDVGKLEKPLYAEFVTEQSPQENRFRSTASELTGSQASKPAAETPTLKQFDLTDYGFFTQSWTMVNGLLPVDKTNHYLRDLVHNGLPHVYEDQINGVAFDELYETQIRVDTNGMWWWTYAVNIRFKDGDTDGHLVFTDVTLDDYSLWVIAAESILSPEWHKVSYNSRFPSLVRIESPI